MKRDKPRIVGTGPIKDNILTTAREVCGETTKTGRVIERETWWWNPDVQSTIREKRLVFR